MEYNRYVKMMYRMRKVLPASGIPFLEYYHEIVKRINEIDNSYHGSVNGGIQSWDDFFRIFMGSILPILRSSPSYESLVKDMEIL